MARPLGSKNKTTKLRRTQHTIRLAIAERAVMEVAAGRLGLTWGEWARQVLRQAAGLPALAQYEAKNKGETEKE